MSSRNRTLIAVVATLVAAAALVGGAMSTTHGMNGLITFSQGVKGHFQLFTIRADGSNKRSITNGSADWVNADWSPDGESIVAERDGSHGASIVVMAANGSRLRNLTPRGFQDQPSYSPDGKWIVYQRDLAGENNGIWLMRSDGTALRRVTACGCDTDPNFSPSGKLISFVRVKTMDRLQALFVVRPDGSGLRQLTPYTWDVGIKHDWSPDGELILLTTNADLVTPGESANLVTIRPDGTGRTKLTQFKDPSKSAFAGSFSPDGKQIVFRLEEGRVFSLAVMPPQGGDIARLTTGPDKLAFIDWGSHQ
jgi:Tol biopolymer transport system component